MTRSICLITIILAMFALAACRDEDDGVSRTDPAYEKSLVDSGLRPMGEEDANNLLEDRTVYATYALTEQKRIEYFNGSGVVVQSPVPDDPAASAGRALLFGSWWGDGNKTCFAYGSSDYVECYRLYYREGTLLYVQTQSSRYVPAGALLAYSTEIRKGNSEEFPLIGQ